MRLSLLAIITDPCLSASHNTHGGWLMPAVIITDPCLSASHNVTPSPTVPYAIITDPSLRLRSGQGLSASHNSTGPSYVHRSIITDPCLSASHNLSPALAERLFIITDPSLSASHNQESPRRDCAVRDPLQMQGAKRGCQRALSVFFEVSHPFGPVAGSTAAAGCPGPIYVILTVPPELPELLQPHLPNRPVQKKMIYGSAAVPINAEVHHFLAGP